MSPLSIAVVGSGISALSAAWLLSKHHQVTVFESEKRIGGHSNTVEAQVGGKTVPVDTGFIVFNPDSYPNLVALFDHLDVDTPETKMSFSASLGGGDYEYSGSGPRGLFGQASNITSLKHWQMLKDIRRFFRQAKASGNAVPADISLAQWLSDNGYSDAFIENHLKPMAAAIWSTPSADVLDFPAASFMRFFDNHGLLKVRNRPKWRTVKDGSREYIRKIMADGQINVRLDSKIESIQRLAHGVLLTDKHGNRHHHDHVVIGAHADEALDMLYDADQIETDILSQFQYVDNHTVLHTDINFMPQRKRLWSSWNYIEREDEHGQNRLTVSYWMNKLQPLDTKTDLFVTLNPAQPIAKQNKLAEFNYSHPLFNEAAMDAQQNLWDLQGRRRTWFCGSYFGFGFHEDGLQSGLAVAEDLGGAPRPWSVDNHSGRIHRKAVVPIDMMAEAAE